ncbi:MAG: hypothetical protein HKO56_03285 [Bacteroidia bacterium]|nr:hypothetical protein [Bacteroidia bacterium]NNC85268.1 hypothetical protein [Bacteroidia bacterium]NNM15659.1 hypothetical protein [Bacteroidia bacterium]
MKSVKDLKKNLNNVVNEIVEDAYSFMLNNPGKKEKKANEIIDEAADKKDEIIALINSRAELNDRKAVKAHFAKIKTEISGLKDKLGASVTKL